MPTGTTAPVAGPTVADSAGKRLWPARISERIQALRAALADQAAPVTADELARGFTRANSATVADLFATLASLGHIREIGNGQYQVD